MSIEVLLADDHQTLRDGLRYALERDSRFTVVEQEASDGDEAIALYREHRPDVLLMDVKMPTTTGVKAAVEILDKDPYANIILFTAHDEPGNLTRALQAGCRGYILKSAHAGEVMMAIEKVCNGGMFIDHNLARELTIATGSAPKLADRECEVLTLLAKGYTIDQAAAKLIISDSTVRTHVKNASRKLQADNRTHAVALALVRGLIQL